MPETSEHIMNLHRRTVCKVKPKYLDIVALFLIYLKSDTAVTQVILDWPNSCLNSFFFFLVLTQNKMKNEGRVNNYFAAEILYQNSGAHIYRTLHSRHHNSSVAQNQFTLQRRQCRCRRDEKAFRGMPFIPSPT